MRLLGFPAKALELLRLVEVALWSLAVLASKSAGG